MSLPPATFPIGEKTDDEEAALAEFYNGHPRPPIQRPELLLRVGQVAEQEGITLKEAAERIFISTFTAIVQGAYPSGQENRDLRKQLRCKGDMK